MGELLVQFVLHLLWLGQALCPFQLQEISAPACSPCLKWRDLEWDGFK